jgi:hypothetical protein
MVQHRVVAIVIFAVFLVLTAGCAIQRPPASAGSGVDASPANGASAIQGTWRGAFHQVGGDGHLEGVVTLTIRDDATYTLISTRSGGGRGPVTDRGTVVANGRRVTLRSASGESVPLTFNGRTLYGVTRYASSHAIKIMVERVEAP